MSTGARLALASWDHTQAHLSGIEHRIGPALQALHDAQPGYPSGSDGTLGSGGSSRTELVALGHDPAKDALALLVMHTRHLEVAAREIARLVADWAPAAQPVDQATVCSECGQPPSPSGRLRGVPRRCDACYRRWRRQRA